ncbi:alpha/beta hydrolase [Pedobacter sp. P351]|uniref:alpha/beta hydrolase n=1 Tax=Pedobacter superstes TaxID=3133441 RepID=UPI0030B498A7
MKLKILLLNLSILGLTADAFSQLESKFPKDTSYNVARVYSQVKKQFPYISPAIDSVPDNVKAYRNLVYAVLPQTPYGKRELHLDLFQPRKSGKYPALIMIHGGGWRSGEKSMQVPMAQMIAAKGFVTIPVEYQLSLEAKYPAAVHNIKAAIRWIRANASTYNIDSDKIAISGCSAGGQLAALVAATNGIKYFEGNMGNEIHSSSVQAAIDIDGVINFLAPASLNLERAKNSPDVEWLGGSYVEKPAIWKEASPAYWANEKMVPMLFLNSGFSRFHAGQDELCGQLKEWGVYNEVYKFNVKVHPFWLFHPWVDESVQYMGDFLNKIFVANPAN